MVTARILLSPLAPRRSHRRGSATRASLLVSTAGSQIHASLDRIRHSRCRCWECLVRAQSVRRVSGAGLSALPVAHPRTGKRSGVAVRRRSWKVRSHISSTRREHCACAPACRLPGVDRAPSFHARGACDHMRSLARQRQRARGLPLLADSRRHCRHSHSCLARGYHSAHRSLRSESSVRVSFTDDGAAIHHADRRLPNNPLQRTWARVARSGR